MISFDAEQVKEKIGLLAFYVEFDVSVPEFKQIGKIIKDI